MNSKLLATVLSVAYSLQSASAAAPGWANLPRGGSSAGCAGCLLSGGVWTALKTKSPQWSNSAILVQTTDTVLNWDCTWADGAASSVAAGTDKVAWQLGTGLKTNDLTVVAQNDYLLLASCPFYTDVCGTKQYFTHTKVEFDETATSVPKLVEGHGCTYFISAQCALPTFSLTSVSLKNSVGPPDGLYVRVLEWDDGTLIKTPADAAGTRPPLPDTTESVLQFQAGAWGRNAGRPNVPGDWAPFREFTYELTGTDANVLSSYTVKSKTLTPEGIEKAYAGYAERADDYSAKVAAYYVEYQVYLAALAAWFGNAPTKPSTPSPFEGAYSDVLPPVDAQYQKKLDDTEANKLTAAKADSAVLAGNGGWGSPSAYTYDQVVGGWTIYGAYGQDTRDVTQLDKDGYLGLTLTDPDACTGKTKWKLVTLTGYGVQAWPLGTAKKLEFKTGAGGMGRARRDFAIWAAPETPAAPVMAASDPAKTAATTNGASHLAAAFTASAAALAALSLF